jgi:hypothetical protein
MWGTFHMCTDIWHDITEINPALRPAGYATFGIPDWMNVKSVPFYDNSLVNKIEKPVVDIAAHEEIEREKMLKAIRGENE